MEIDKQHLDVLCAIAEEAGAAIMEIYATAFGSVDKADQSPLTVADVRSDAIIRARLEQHFPGIFILSEESRSTGGNEQKTFFLVDPLDGTKEFIQRNGEFTVNIALVIDGAAVAGVVYAPALGQLYYAAKGWGAWLRSCNTAARIRVALWDGLASLRVIGSRSHGGREMDQWLQSLPCAHTLVTAGSSLKLCMVAAGMADVYPRLAPTSQWDTAAAQCVLEQAGGAVLSLTRQPLRYGLDLPLLNHAFFALGEGIDHCLLPHAQAM